MIQIIKLIVSAFVILIITEIAKKNAGLAGLIAVMPINIMISLLWINYETRDIKLINQFIHSAFRGIIPLSCFLFVLYLCHKKSVPFEISFALATVLLVVTIYAQNKMLHII